MGNQNDGDNYSYSGPSGDARLNEIMTGACKYIFLRPGESIVSDRANARAPGIRVILSAVRVRRSRSPR